MRWEMKRERCTNQDKKEKDKTKRNEKSSFIVAESKLWTGVPHLCQGEGFQTTQCEPLFFVD